MGLKDTFLCSVFALALPIGQAMFKFAAIFDAGLEGPFWLRAIQNWPLLGAFAWYGMTALFWFFVLTRVPLSSAYLFSLVGSALVPVIAWVVFKEPFSWGMLAGYALILVGLTIVMAQSRA